MTLIEFLKERWDEEEAIAIDAARHRGPDWHVAEQKPRGWGAGDDPDEIIAGGKPILTTTDYAGGVLTADHIARHDPASVLRDIAAKRAIVELHREGTDSIRGTLIGDGECRECEQRYPCATVRLLAAVHAAHPDYDPAWAPTT